MNIRRSDLCAYQLRDAEQLLSGVGQIEFGGSDLPLAAVRDALAAQRARDDLVPEADA